MAKQMSAPRVRAQERRGSPD